MTGQQDENNQLSPSPNNGHGSSAPTLEPWQKWVRGTFYVLSPIGFFVALYQLCFQQPITSLFSCYTCWAYIGFGVAILGLIVIHYFRYSFVAYYGRLEDQSEIRSWIVNARTAEPRLVDPETKPDNFDQKVERLTREVERLERIGPNQWTEYQVLPLNQMLIDFMKIDDLTTEAQSTLGQLQEYAEDSSYRYDKEYYGKWKERIDEATRKIPELENSPEERKTCDDAAEPLRAVLRTLYGHVADYRKNWTEGSAIVRSLMSLVAMTIPIVLVMGLVPVLHPAGDNVLRALNWGLLGISGSLTAALLTLRQSDLVEVGNTEGKKELWRTVLGAALGLVAGILSYGIISGGLLNGHAVPTIGSGEIGDIGLSIVWGVASGFSFERIFERMRSATESGN